MTTVGECGEDGVLARIGPLLARGEHTVLGPGDDCAVVTPHGDLAITTDVVCEGQHFRREWSSGADVGERAVAQNLADVVAMGARPLGLVVGLALPADTPVEWVSEFARGLNRRAQEMGVGIEGGDLTSTNGPLIVSVSAYGDLSGMAPVLRSGAKVGDAVVIAGTLGHSRTGLELYRRGLIGPDGDLTVEEASSQQRACAARCAAIYRAPRPPLRDALQAAKVLHAMMDVSDGLARDAQRMARASEVSLAFQSELLAPFVDDVAECDQLCISSAWDRIMTGGEDHAFLATCDSGAIPAGFVPVGTVVERRDSWVSLDGRALEGTLGWESLS